MKPNNTPGFLISIDGIDGSGKTSLASSLYAALKAKQPDVLLTREPGGTALGEALRDLLLNPDVNLNHRAEFLLFNAARSQHVTEVIQPALQAGSTVITDRFTATTYAYQGFARGLKDSLSDFEMFVIWSAHGLRPHLTLILDLPVKEAIARRQQRDNGLDIDRFDHTAHAFMEDARFAYREQGLTNADTYLLNATKSPDQMLSEALAILRGVQEVQQMQELQPT